MLRADVNFWRSEVRDSSVSWTFRIGSYPDAKEIVAYLDDAICTAIIFRSTIFFHFSPPSAWVSLRTYRCSDAIGWVQMSVCYRSNNVKANGMSCFYLSPFIHTNLFPHYIQSFCIKFGLRQCLHWLLAPSTRNLPLLQHDVRFKEALRGSLY